MPNDTAACQLPLFKELVLVKREPEPRPHPFLMAPAAHREILGRISDQHDKELKRAAERHSGGMDGVMKALLDYCGTDTRSVVVERFLARYFQACELRILPQFISQTAERRRIAELHRDPDTGIKHAAV